MFALERTYSQYMRAPYARRQSPAAAVPVSHDESDPIAESAKLAAPPTNAAAVMAETAAAEPQAPAAEVDDPFVAELESGDDEDADYDGWSVMQYESGEEEDAAATTEGDSENECLCGYAFCRVYSP